MKRYNKWLGVWLSLVLLTVGCSAFRSTGPASGGTSTVAAINGNDYRQRAVALLQQGDYYGARQLLVEAYKHNPQNGATLFYLGLTLELLQKEALAFQVYARFVKLSANDPYRKFLQGRYHWLARGILSKQYRQARATTTEPVIPNQVVVLPFMVRSQTQEWQGMGRALAELLTWDLGVINRLHVIDGLQQQALFQALSISETTTLSGQLVHRVQEAAKSGQVIVGAVVEKQPGEVALTATVVDYRKGILPVVSVQGKLSDFFKLQKQLTLNLLKALDIRLTIEEREQLRYTPTTQWMALLPFGLGLTHEDQGDYDLAVFYYEQALGLDGQFRLARQRLDYSRTLQVVSGEAYQVLQLMGEYKISRAN